MLTSSSKIAAEPWELAGNARFQLRRALGEGGFGTVYEVLDRDRGARVALKLLRRVEAEDLYHFKQEFRVLTDITHPNLAQLYELLGHGGRWFFTMELVDGVDALTYVRQRSVTGTGTGTGTGSEEPTQPISGARPSAPAAVPEPEPPASRRRPAFDEARLRATLLQLVDGLGALHDAGQVHRDVKPPNVLVTAEGRVVLLDFGLVARLSHSGEASRASMVGTPAYLPPELLYGQPSTPAGDWYAMGVLLYEALTGELPFHGNITEVLQQKLERDPLPPSALVRDVPPDLDELCLALLARRPEERPDREELVERLGGSSGPRSGPAVIPFVGRDAERRALGGLFSGVRHDHRAAVALVGGASGIGKSALLRRACEELRRSAPGAVVLSGRCYEQESVPYKAIDGLIDPLSRYLKLLPPRLLEGLLPPDVGTLALLFPVLGQVEAVGQTPVRAVPRGDAPELRRRAGVALRQLLTRLAEHRPLVLVIDDLQWGDHDSGALLVELMAPPDPPPLLLLIAYRAEDAASNPCLPATLPALWAVAGPALVVETIPLVHLAEGPARELARALLPGGTGADALVGDVVREAGGHPYFVCELAALARGHGVGPTVPSLDALVRAGVEELPEGARRLLEVVALAGRPVSRAAAGRAADLGDEGPGMYGVLRAARLVRGRDAADRDEIETYHDRIREGVVAGLSAGRRVEIFRRLAQALEGTGLSDPETLAVYFLEAGDEVRAAALTEQAAAAAARSLAFDRAARLYQRTLDLRPANDSTRRGLTEALAGALADAGYGTLAVRALRAAAEGAAPERAFDLRRRAAKQLLCSGDVDGGLAAFRQSCSEVGLQIPEARWRVLLGAVAGILQLSLRGFAVRPGATPSPHALRGVDILLSTARGLVSVDTVLAGYLGTRALRAALAAGETRRVFDALAIFVALTGAAGLGRLRVARDAARTFDELGAELGDPRAQVHRELVAGYRAMSHDMGESRLRLRAAEAIVHERGAGIFERNTLEEIVCMQLYWSGAWRELADRLGPSLAAARARDNQHVARTLSLRFGHLPAFLADDPAEGARLHAAARAGWWPTRFGPFDHFALLSTTDLLLFGDHGRGARAYRYVETQWQALERSQILRLEGMAVYPLNVRARAALAWAAADDDAEAPRALKIAERAAKRLGRLESPFGQALGKLALAGVAAGRRQDAEAQSRFQEADARLTEVGCLHYAAAAQRRLGELRGGPEGAALMAEADAYLRAQGARNPARIMAMLAPGRWDEPGEG
jgi:hypothetical protein